MRKGRRKKGEEGRMMKDKEIKTERTKERTTCVMCMITAPAPTAKC
jgi:hypothetical protein